MASSTQGIQTLLDAESEASKIVGKARQYRIQRLKDARVEAQKEIDALKAEKAKEFADFEKQFSGESDDRLVKAAEQTEKSLAEIQVAYKQNKEAVIEKLLSTIVDCQPKAHVNAKRTV